MEARSQLRHRPTHGKVGIINSALRQARSQTGHAPLESTPGYRPDKLVFSAAARAAVYPTGLPIVRQLAELLGSTRTVKVSSVQKCRVPLYPGAVGSASH